MEVINKEMLAIIRAMEEWRQILEGVEHQFEVWIDHKNLEYFMTAKKQLQAGPLVFVPGPFQHPAPPPL
jgi:RNase H-like domain found in reverse transcriptase